MKQEREGQTEGNRSPTCPEVEDAMAVDNVHRLMKAKPAARRTAKIGDGDQEQETVILNPNARCAAKDAKSQMARKLALDRRHVEVLLTELRLETIYRPGRGRLEKTCSGSVQERCDWRTLLKTVQTSRRQEDAGMTTTGPRGKVKRRDLHRLNFREGSSSKKKDMLCQRRRDACEAVRRLSRNFSRSEGGDETEDVPSKATVTTVQAECPCEAKSCRALPERE